MEMSTKLKGEVALAVHEREDTLQLRAKLVKVKPQREQCQLQDCPCGGPSKRQPSLEQSRGQAADGPQVMRHAYPVGVPLDISLYVVSHIT